MYSYNGESPWSSLYTKYYRTYMPQADTHKTATFELTCTWSFNRAETPFFLSFFLCLVLCQGARVNLGYSEQHYRTLRRFVAALYESIRNHKHILSLDQALQSSDFEMLVKLCYDDAYQKILSSATVLYTSSNASSIQDAPIGLQQLKLPDLEADLYLGYAEMIANLEKILSDDAEFACCSCERLHQRKQVMALKFSDKKVSSDICRTLNSFKCCRADALRVSVL